jgi:menaquinone-dependent protoporphyrinogen IX oxidase
MSTAIVYYSKHHENTKKLVDAIKEAHPDVKTIDITENRVMDLSQYTRIGIASGIYASKFALSLMEYLKEKICIYRTKRSAAIDIRTVCN